MQNVYIFYFRMIGQRRNHVAAFYGPSINVATSRLWQEKLNSCERSQVLLTRVRVIRGNDGFALSDLPGKVLRALPPSDFKHFKMDRESLSRTFRQRSRNHCQLIER